MFAFLILGAGLGIAGPSVLTARAQAAYSHDVWTTEDGLPINWVYDVAQTDDGYLWISTGSGLARFDGLRFEVFDQSNTEALPSNEMRGLHHDAAGTLWIDTDNGLVTYRDGQFRRLEDSPYRYPFYEDQNESLWLNTTHGIARYRDGTFTEVSPRAMAGRRAGRDHRRPQRRPLCLEG